jgi:dethiobiotin synthetase
MSGPVLYVTGTGTGVGKTTLATLLLQRAREKSIRVAAFKPFCSGGRDDAEKLHALQTAGQSLDQVNPFYFEEPIAPLVTARNQGIRVTLDETLKKFPSLSTPLLVEGAGGLLTPLGENLSLLEIIQAIPGRVCIVAQNSLGVLNHTLLTANQLVGFKLAIVLMEPAEADASTRSNPPILQEMLPQSLIVEIPRVPRAGQIPELDELLKWWLLKQGM